MPDFVPISNCARVDMVYQWNGQTVENVFHVQGTAAWDVSTLTALAGAFDTWWKGDIAPSMSTEISLVLIRVTDLTTQTATGIEIGIGGSNSGAVNTPSVPNNVAVAVKMTTNLRGRSYRGRSYVAGIASGSVTANTLSNDMVVALKEGYEALRDTAFGNGGELCIASRFTGNAPRATGVTNPVTGIFVDTTIDSQRRRLPGRGR